MTTVWDLPTPQHGLSGPYFSRNYPKVSSEDLLEAPKRVQSRIWISAQKVEWAKRDFQ